MLSQYRGAIPASGCDERQGAAALRHKEAVKLMTLSQEPGTSALSMRFCLGSLEDHCTYTKDFVTKNYYIPVILFIIIHYEELLYTYYFILSLIYIISYYDDFLLILLYSYYFFFISSTKSAFTSTSIAILRRDVYL